MSFVVRFSLATRHSPPGTRYSPLQKQLLLCLPCRPLAPLEKAVQFIKGGLSFRVKKELGFRDEVWQQSFTERRIKDAADYAHHREYIRMNPVRAKLVGTPEEYAYSSAASGVELDECPPWLKPHSKGADTQG